MYTSEYPIFSVTVDVVVLHRDDGPPGRWSVLLVRRGSDPDAGAWALPGGFVEIDEDLAVGAARELHEETGVRVSPDRLSQVGAYGAPGRDPRGRMVSIAHLAVLEDRPDPAGGDDAADAAWQPVDLVLGPSGAPMALDHDRILRDALAIADLGSTA